MIYVNHSEVKSSFDCSQTEIIAGTVTGHKAEIIAD